MINAFVHGAVIGGLIGILLFGVIPWFTQSRICKWLTSILYEDDETFEARKRKMEEQMNRNRAFQEDQRKRTVIVRVENNNSYDGGLDMPVW